MKPRLSKKTKVVTEGVTKLNVPDIKDIPERGFVFYNPLMELDRTISVNVLADFFKNEKIRVCDLLSGLGARAVRYANELPAKGVECEVFANDIQPSATRLIEKNAALNGVSVNISNCEANHFLLDHKSDRFNCIDIDPFGSPSPFLTHVFSAIVPRHSLLCVTATDLGTLSGVYSRACFKRYGIISQRTSFANELGLRNLVAFIQREAAKQDYAVTPVFSYQNRHYDRAFLRLDGSKKKSARNTERIGFVKYCGKCERREYVGVFDSLDAGCACGGKAVFLGPTWIGALGESNYLPKPTEEYEIRELYYDLSALCKKHKGFNRKLDVIISALKDAGFAACRTHFDGNSVKTNAPFDELIKSVF